MKKLIICKAIALSALFASQTMASNLKPLFNPQNFSSSMACSNFMYRSAERNFPNDYINFFKDATQGFGSWSTECINGNCTLSTGGRQGLCQVIYPPQMQLPVSSSFFPSIKNLLVPIIQNEVNRANAHLTFDGKQGMIEITCHYSGSQQITSINDCTYQFSSS